MIELLGSGVMGALAGGLFRLAPELLKFFDRKNERQHELEMFKLQTSLELQRSNFKVEEKYVDFGVAQMDAIGEAFKEQAASAANSYKWVSALSALVRPVVTYVLFGMYVVFKFTMIGYAMSTGADWVSVIKEAWTLEDFAMLNMILTFWFIGRN